VDTDTGKELWRFQTSTTIQAPLDIVEESPTEFVIKLKEEFFEEGKESYVLRVDGFLDDVYRIDSTYKTESEYRPKEKYR
jgi:hypothetical protein